jgi:raffinose/stachyose/melibiose transport system substrate-binding protein
MKPTRILVSVVCLSLILTMFAGCTQTTAPTAALTSAPAATAAPAKTDTPATPAPTKQASVTLTLLANQDWVTKPYMKIAWANYEAATGNKLDIQAVPIDSGESIMKTKFATGEIPDIFMHFGGYGLAAYQPEKNFVDFSDAKWVSDIQDFVLPQAKFNGKVYGLPHWEASISGIIFNKEIFDKLSIAVPTTQAEFMAACEKLKAGGVTPMYLAFKDSWPLLYQFAVDSMVQDTALLDKLNSNQAKYADIPAFKSMLEWYKAMADKGYLGTNYATNTWDGAPAALGGGKYAMMLAWDSYADSDLEPKFPGLSQKFSIMPAFAGANDQGNYEGPNVCLTFVNKNGKNVQAATDFVNFLADPVNYNAAFKDFGTAPVFKGETSNKTTSLYNSMKDVILKKTLASTAWPSIIGFTQVEGAKYIQDLMIGNITVDQCIASMDKDRTEIAKAQKIPGFEN